MFSMVARVVELEGSLCVCLVVLGLEMHLVGLCRTSVDFAVYGRHP